MLRQLSTSRILRNDYPSLLLLIFAGGFLILCTAAAIFGVLPIKRGDVVRAVNGKTIAAIMVVVSVALAAICGWLSRRRIDLLKRVIDTGPIVEGHVTSVWFDKDRGRVEYEYSFEGEVFKAGNAVWKNRVTLPLQPGAAVRLIVDPEKPSRAFLADLYSPIEIPK